jgi:ribonuclease VapC
MVIDSSALISILLGEGDANRFIAAINTGVPLLIAAPTWLEAAMVVSARKGAAGFQEFEQLIAASGIELIEFDQTLAREAYLAWQRFGKGRHPASLNMGDCFSYALAKQRKDVLLFKGNDFSETDLVAAISLNVA